MIVAPSLLAADAGFYAQDVQQVQNLGAKYLHIDVMDGHFVPNLGFSPSTISGLRSYSDIYFDTHLMMMNPTMMVQPFIDAGSNAITIHAEVQCDFAAIAKTCKEQGVDFGVAIKPSTSIESIKKLFPLVDLLLIMAIEPGFGGQSFMPMALDKIRDAVTVRKELDLSFLISVDGGVGPSLVKDLEEAGIDIVVSGSAIFGSADRAQTMKDFFRKNK